MLAAPNDHPEGQTEDDQNLQNGQRTEHGERNSQSKEMS